MIIALLGNPFSPAYARARGRRSDVRPLSYCAMNVAVYGKRARAWALRERSVEEGARGADGIVLGSSTMGWQGDTLVVDIRERQSPWGAPLRGRVVFRPDGRFARAYALDGAGLHRWWPIAPTGRIDVDLAEPVLHFRGNGYHDANAGDVALEDSLSGWAWSRAHPDPGRALLTYEVTETGGTRRAFAIDFRARGEPRELSMLRSFALPKTVWGVDRRILADAQARPAVAAQLEDTPFYARTLVRSRMANEPVVAMHEALSVDRLRRAWVRFLLPFRMGKAR